MKYTKEFEEEKLREIERLEKHNEFLINLDNANLSIVTNEERERLDTILQSNKRYLHKLQSNEFEIAIVGLEKAGKSTFANALIENTVLPSAPERCTFTSTRLTNGDDSAIVEFYKEDEFNEIFIELLQEIDYPNAEKENFKTISLDKFQAFFDELENKNPDKHKNHVGKTDEEIKDIIKGRNKLTLTGKTKKFSGDELSTDAFQAYIKGENKGADTSKPRSVKKVEINSSKLQKLDSAIIYDVPGFDSPTKIHERQTIERLKSADAIILVTNVGRNPSLVGTQLNVITNNADTDGIPLRDKLFVFGNQLDTANSEDESKGNIKTLEKDVSKYKIAEQKRVFTGSALKYLVHDTKIMSKKEYKLSYEFNSGIEDIYNELVHYYETDRFEILKRKINLNQKELNEIFKNVSQRGETDFDPNFAENEKSRITREAYKEIEALLEKNLKELKYKLKEEIWEEKYFSSKFQEDVENLDYFKSIEEDAITKAKIYEDDSLTLDTPIEKMNQAVRKDLHKKFLKEFSDLIRYMTDEKSKDIELNILRTFTSSIVGSQNSVLFEEVEKESEVLIKKLTLDVSHNDGRFTYLIERFSRDVFDILISYPLFTQDRKNKFKEASKEFSYLDNYYENSNGTLLNMLLTGEKKKTEENLLALAKSIVSFASNSYNWTNRIENVLHIAKTIVKIAESNTKIDIEEVLKDKKSSKNEEEVLNEINQDILNLRDILQKAIVPAINLELAFLNAIDKQIKILLNSFQTTGTQESNDFNDFISKIVPKIKAQELGNINQKLESYKQEQKFLKEMQKFEF